MHTRSFADLAFDASIHCMHMCSSAFDSVVDDQEPAPVPTRKWGSWTARRGCNGDRTNITPGEHLERCKHIQVIPTRSKLLGASPAEQNDQGSLKTR